MRRHLNTLYVTSQDAWLNKDGLNVVVSVANEERGRVPIHTIGGIVTFGRALASPPLMEACAEAGVTLTHLSENGRFLARVEGPVSGNVLLRRAQYRASDDPARRDAVIRSIVTAKTANQRAVLSRAGRDHGPALAPEEQDAMSRAGDRLAEIVRRCAKPVDGDALRGFEGEAAFVYFSVFDHLIRGDKAEFSFGGRSRRPPLDSVNALLSFIYVLLAADVRSALETVGLDPAAGFLHRDRPGRPSLALDVMEEFRPFFADRLALSLINRRQLSAKDFRKVENGAVLLNDDGRKAVLVAYQERKRDELVHPFIEEKVTLGLAWHIQAQLLARHLRGDLDAYPPFLWK